ncbi:alpha-ketoglutarate-dependent dioxygenase AlkB [Phenylobacterium deserti]|uniref:Alpha-ketoglutarate-dependent dioxygenase AlkB n=1 Tax=Phenylobacterium deserti TaxID=1914756 RepID=A0A328ASF6_9CAUL|nr:alpha-ketoglutarate-dependent dioxygenase AlkB [Phenylobacterium deserti]RAK56454.1 alpha-ketoglutarate-dependent dioxygenase AlkB [Phenylobacterium deserti]
MPAQPGLFDDAPADLPLTGLPEGFRYQPAVLSLVEERDLLARFEALPFEPFDFQGWKANRHVIYFGHAYDFSRGRLAEAQPMPAWLLPFRDRAAAFAGLAPEALPHVLINKYAPGAGIGWHRDRPQFEDVVGLSVGAPCIFRLRRRTGGGFERASLKAEPGSAYLLRGPARAEWEHSIPPVEQLRYSITFRSLRG